MTNCWYCGKEDPQHKVGEELSHGEAPKGHNLTTYICCICFRALMGPAVTCAKVEALA